MVKIDLSKYGITNVEKIIYNPSYDELFKAETDPSLTGYEKGIVTNTGAVAVKTGKFTEDHLKTNIRLKIKRQKIPCGGTEKSTSRSPLKYGMS